MEGHDIWCIRVYLNPMSRGFFSLLMVVLLTGCFGSQPPAPVSYYGRSEGAGSAGVHAVVDGDTLWSVSQRYRIPMRDIAIVNNIHAPFTLHEGDRLKLPPPQQYSVKDGDTLYSVARIFDVDQYEIAQQNNIKSPYRIYEGQVLRLPSAVQTSSVSAPVSRTQKPVQLSRSSASQAASVVRPPRSKPVRVKNLEQKKERITAQTPARSSSRFLQPVQGRIISTYGPKKNGLHNDGINIAAQRGTPVLAAENGVVVYAGSELKGSGNLVLIRHADRWMTAYAHLDGFAVKRGQTIKRGAKIGTVGSTGSVSTPQLHFEVRRGTEAINPKRYL